MTSFVKQNPKSITVSLYIQPGAKKTEVVGLHGDSLKVKIAAAPVDGAANTELVRFFSKWLKISKSQIELKQGSQSRHKVLEVSEITEAQFTDLLLKEGILSIKLG